MLVLLPYTSGRNLATYLIERGESNKQNVVILRIIMLLNVFNLRPPYVIGPAGHIYFHPVVSSFFLSIFGRAAITLGIGPHF